MSEILVRIKRAVLDGRYEFSEKASIEISMLKITRCPTCGGRKIKAVRRNVMREFEGQRYSVPGLAFHECPNCGERLYDRDAMRKIEAHSPAYAKTNTGR